MVTEIVIQSATREGEVILGAVRSAIGAGDGEPREAMCEGAVEAHGEERGNADKLKS